MHIDSSLEPAYLQRTLPPPSPPPPMCRYTLFYEVKEHLEFLKLCKKLLLVLIYVEQITQQR